MHRGRVRRGSRAVGVDRDARGPLLPVSPEERVQGTFDCERAVLVVARTVTSTARLLEALRFFRNDFRVKPLFTINDTSPYSSGARTLLEAAGVTDIVPWDQVPELHYALALSASENVDFAKLRGTTVVLPHGIGFNKWVPDPTTGGTRLAGLPRAEALRSGRVRLVLSHPAQERQLRALCSEVAGHTAVTGDPTYDQLLASLPFRERYRRKLGLGGRRLVLLSSTWRSESELGRWRTLPLEMLASLPADEYQVAVAMHPNVWAWYGPGVIRTWFRDALDAGLLLVPPHRGWHAALVAAHLVVADHGSLSLYSAALGKPLLLAAFGDEHVPGTPIEKLGRMADRLDPRADLRAQVERALDSHDPDRFAELTAEVFAHVGESATLLRDLLYREMGLAPPPGEVPLLRPPDIESAPLPVTAFDTVTRFTGPEDLAIWRYPAAARPPADTIHPGPPHPGAVRHLAVDEDDHDLRRPHQAAVFVRRDVATRTEALQWTAEALQTLPGARVAGAATASGCLARIRNGPCVEATADGVDAMLLASAVYACVLDRSVADRILTVHTGRTTTRVRLGVVS
ncbi:hypothetical protein GCM10009545_24780 [Saccharopolyspora thermophila]|uniref:CDP-Glycerol:Poly(Glycerophosphate) glycerophosphotransferase n=1 Tax=Saccharopolyspora thermophila TaxID=89367 RepID=A0ABN1CLS7_9PSEU